MQQEKVAFNSYAKKPEMQKMEIFNQISCDWDTKK